jgi:hypothetical protein
MDTARLSNQPIEQILSEFDAIAAASGPTAPAVAALTARLTSDLTRSLADLTGMVFTAKKQMVERMDALAVEIKGAQQAMQAASSEASKHSEALVRWTKALVFVTIAYTVITGGLLIVTLIQRK